MKIARTIPKIVLAALFAAVTAAGVILTQATQPAERGALPASAQGYPYHRPGYYRYHGRYWAHRRWRRGYYDPYHRWHPGIWVYF